MGILSQDGREFKMRVNLPPKVRATIYALNVLGSPLMAYLLAKGVIGTLEVGLWAAEMTAVFAMAGLNTSNPEEK